MSCGGGHLGFPIGIKNIKFVEDLPMIIPGQFGFNCPSGFRAEDLNVIFYQNMPNLHNQYKSAERKISQKNQRVALQCIGTDKINTAV
jgi:hypothetical protein